MTFPLVLFGPYMGMTNFWTHEEVLRHTHSFNPSKNFNGGVYFFNKISTHAVNKNENILNNAIMITMIT